MASEPFEDLEHRALQGESEAQILLSRRLAKIGQTRRAEDLLRRAVLAGSIDAMADLGKHLLTGARPVTRSLVDEGRRLIVTAAHMGRGEAAHFAAMIHAIERNWTLALEFLDRSAGLGYGRAQRELAVLARDENAVKMVGDGRLLAPDRVRHLREAVDPGSRMAIPPARRLSADPIVAVVENFVSSQTCDWLVEQTRPKLAKAQSFGSTALSDSQSQGPAAAKYPLPPSHSASTPELDLATLPLFQRIAAITNLPINGMEPTSSGT